MKHLTEKKHVVFTDVDGTIYPFPDKTFTKQTLDKFEELKIKGVPVVLNTGNPASAKIQKLAEKVHSDYIICANGAMVFDNVNKKPAFVEHMPLSELKKVWEVSDIVKAPLYYFGDTQYYLKDMSLEWQQFLEKFTEYYQFITHGEIVDNIHKVEVYGEPELIQAFYDEALKHDIDLNIVNLNTHIEITKRGVSKASGLKWVCENIYQCSIDDVMAIGDSPNDISVLEIAGYSYAMDNADRLTKNIAKYYTSDVKQNGFAEAVDDYLYRSDFELKKQISQQTKKK